MNNLDTLPTDLLIVIMQNNPINELLTLLNFISSKKSLYVNKHELKILENNLDISLPKDIKISLNNFVTDLKYKKQNKLSTFGKKELINIIICSLCAIRGNPLKNIEDITSYIDNNVANNEIIKTNKSKGRERIPSFECYYITQHCQLNYLFRTFRDLCPVYLNIRNIGQNNKIYRILVDNTVEILIPSTLFFTTGLLKIVAEHSDCLIVSIDVISTNQNILKQNRSRFRYLVVVGFNETIERLEFQEQCTQMRKMVFLRRNK